MSLTNAIVQPVTQNVREREREKGRKKGGGGGRDDFQTEGMRVYPKNTTVAFSCEEREREREIVRDGKFLLEKEQLGPSGQRQ